MLLALASAVALAQSSSGLTSLERAYLSKPGGASSRASLHSLTAKPHVAGTDGDLETALFVQRTFLEAGLSDASLDPQRVLLSYPVDRSLSLLDSTTGAIVHSASLAEAVLPEDPTSDTWWRNMTFNACMRRGTRTGDPWDALNPLIFVLRPPCTDSPSGTVVAPLVYANFGLPEDFAALAAANVTVAGSIVIVRYGKCFRGNKALNAQRAGALAAVLYSDPHEDGFARGATFPDGPWRPRTSVQRGSIQYLSTCPGDPSRAYAPGGRSVREVCGFEQRELIPQIPVLPISWGDALAFLEAVQGPDAPSAFEGSLTSVGLTGYRLGPSVQRARLVVHNRFETAPIWNVIATIPGNLPRDLDRPLILGNQ